METPKNETKEVEKRPYEVEAETLAKDIFRVTSTMFGMESMIQLAAHKIEEAMEKLDAEVSETQYQTGYEDGTSDGNKEDMN